MIPPADAFVLEVTVGFFPKIGCYCSPASCECETSCVFSEPLRPEETLPNTGSSSTPPSLDALPLRTRAVSPDIWPTSAPSPRASTVSLVSKEEKKKLVLDCCLSTPNCSDAHIFRQQHSSLGLMLKTLILSNSSHMQIHPSLL